MTHLTPIRPPALKPGDTIAIISPSMRLNISNANDIKRAKSLLSSKGYQVREIFKPEEPTIQSCISSRLSEFRGAFMSPDISAVICTIGGTTFTELLPALLADKELHAAIRAHPKVVVGSSDITGVHWFLNAVAGLRTFYGPGIIPELGEPVEFEPHHGDPKADGEEASTLDFTVRNFLKAVATTEPIGDVQRAMFYAPYALPSWTEPTSPAAALDPGPRAPNPGWLWLRHGRGRVEGRLFGGCITVMARLAGVRAIVPDWKGRIVFIETATENPLERVQAGIADLIAQGVFDDAAGVVVGRPHGYDEPERREAYINVVRSLLCEGRLGEKTDFPVLFGVDFGHTTPMVTLPYDAVAMMDGANDRFAIVESGVVGTA
ncbi:peptidase family S66 [Xylariaceae sp. FL0255]|nr:peptidase family S66 [Xylariaceae sp. FL0255]